MKVNDIDKTNASSLKKGITTSRNINPLIPNYRYPSWFLMANVLIKDIRC